MEEYNQQSLERIDLLKHLQEAIGGAPPHFWAACQICDLKALERMIKCGREYPEMFRGFAQQTSTMVHYWGPTPPRSQSEPSTPKQPTPQKPMPSNLSSLPSTPPIKRQKTLESPVVMHRNQQVRSLAEHRDKSCCVLTGDYVIEVAHIYPYHSIKHKEEGVFGQRHIFWDHLKNFWSPEKVATWEAEIFPAGICEFGVERVYNLITLSRTAHDMWARGAFALKPILESEDKMTLEVQFFWQERQKDTQQTMSLLTAPSSTQGLNQNVGAYRGPVQLFKNKQNIQSGDYFKLQTDDPVTKPLPSFQLLELQWFLQRIQGMAGAADIDWDEVYLDLESELDDAEEVPSLALDDDDVEELSQPLSSPPTHIHDNNLNLPKHPKRQEVEGGRAGEEGGYVII